MRTTFSQHGLGRYPNLVKGLEPEGSNHIWCADITYIRVRLEFLYLAVLMDLLTRGIRGWYLGQDLSEMLVRTALERALAAHPGPRIHHSDQGVQYAAHGYVALLIASVTFSMTCT
ncbi:MAG: DDE-type integrase/transposase/recombinase [Ardenticatenia bacterium]|nr:DDE-type integrase/transposase/recombinase [Ardenticatenia bacterium]